MYSKRIIESSIAKYEESANLKLKRTPIKEVESWITDLNALLNPETNRPARPLRKEEMAFIHNERVMSMMDFRYWAARYGTIQRDGGGICKFSNPWQSQLLILSRMSKVEEEMHERFSKGEAVDGIMIVGHKARQLGETALGRLLITHRLTLQNNRRAMSASVDEDKIQELYDRDKLIYDNLPWWLKPELKYDEKRQHLHFERSDSRSLYQVSSQKSGLGVGRQFDLAHLTELSTWINAATVELDFFPTLPMSLSTFVLLESTAYGRGNWWHDFSERVRRGHSRRWRYVFIPWYVETQKYRASAPEGWSPSPISLLHAQKCYDTSPEFCDGRHMMLNRDQLYWYESTRSEYQKGNNLAFFLTNWPATPEESFQHSGQSAFSVELLDTLRTHAHAGEAHELVS